MENKIMDTKRIAAFPKRVVEPSPMENCLSRITDIISIPPADPTDYNISAQPTPETMPQSRVASMGSSMDLVAGIHSTAMEKTTIPKML